LLQHSLATAIAAHSLARIQHPALAPDAFSAGLLQNLGIIVQIHLDTPGTLAMLDARHTDATRNMRALELECASVGHEECVAVLFEEWKLPGSLVAAVRHHHDPISAPEIHRDLASLVNLGANLALACGATFSLEPSAVERDAQAMSILGLRAEDLDNVAAALAEHVAEFQLLILND